MTALILQTVDVHIGGKLARHLLELGLGLGLIGIGIEAVANLTRIFA